MPIRHILAAGAVSALALVGTVTPTAGAAETLCPTPEEMQTSLAGATTAVAEAKAVFQASNRPLGQLVSSTRHEARAELASSRAASKELRRSMRSATPAERAELRSTLKAERSDMKEARGLLSSKRAVLAEIEADRTEARTDLRAAQHALVALRQQAEACTGSTGGTDPSDGDPTGDLGD